MHDQTKADVTKAFGLLLKEMWEGNEWKIKPERLHRAL